MTEVTGGMFPSLPSADPFLCTDRPEWLDVRSSGIGGSDAPIIMDGRCYGKGRHDLWLDKLGMAEDWPETPQMRWGTIMEPHVLEEYQRERGRVQQDEGS